MINITKPLVRKTRRPFMHYKRPIVVAFEPPDMITMWLKGTRTRYSIEIEELFTKLAYWHALAEAIGSSLISNTSTTDNK